MLIPRGAVALTALLVGSCAMIGSVDPKSCAIDDIHFSRAAPTDLGNGLLTTDTGSVVFSRNSAGGVSREVESCSDGSTLTLNYVWVDTINKRIKGTSSDFRPLDQSIIEGKYTSLEAIKAAAKALKIDTQERVEETESCGCAAYYPKLRGDRPAYERPS